MVTNRKGKAMNLPRSESNIKKRDESAIWPFRKYYQERLRCIGDKLKANEKGKKHHGNFDPDSELSRDEEKLLEAEHKRVKQIVGSLDFVIDDQIRGATDGGTISALDQIIETRALRESYRAVNRIYARI